MLLKTVQLASGRKMFYPLMTYCYIDLRTSLQSLLLDPDFTGKCVHWKQLKPSDSHLRDVYDGRVWNQFRQYKGNSFLDDDHAYAFMINMDWFQPYKHITTRLVQFILVYLTYPEKHVTNCRTYASLELFLDLMNRNLR